MESMTDQIIDLWYKLDMMGVLIDYQSFAFGDNHTIIQQSNIPESKLMKCWNAFTFHCIQEAIALVFLQLFHIPTNENPINLLTRFSATKRPYHIYAHTILVQYSVGNQTNTIIMQMNHDKI